jgi:endonuclease YncB( thermonuclease family)
MTRVLALILALAAGCAPQTPPAPATQARFYAAAAATTSATRPARLYDAVVVRIIDGDTVNVVATVPVESDFVTFTIAFPASIRLAGINAPEIRTPAGPAARDALAGLLPVGSHVAIAGVHADKYSGRWDASVTTPDGTDCSAWMLGHGFATKYLP